MERSTVQSCLAAPVFQIKSICLSVDRFSFDGGIVAAEKVASATSAPGEVVGGRALRQRPERLFRRDCCPFITVSSGIEKLTSKVLAIAGCLANVVPAFAQDGIKVGSEHVDRGETRRGVRVLRLRPLPRRHAG